MLSPQRRKLIKKEKDLKIPNHRWLSTIEKMTILQMRYGAQEIKEETVNSIDEIGKRMGLKTTTIRKFITRFKKTGKLFEKR
jgi:hypothetical protein